MSGFEYFSIAVSVILSFSAIRLLDALQHVFSPSRRYWPHALWVIVALAWHVHFWWIFWGYVRVEVWTYLRFVLVLVPRGGRQPALALGSGARWYPVACQRRSQLSAHPLDGGRTLR